MSRYKGQSGAKSVERKFPQPRHGRGRHEDECDFIRWCFADPNIAAAFAAAFGGTLQSTTALRGRGNAES